MTQERNKETPTTSELMEFVRSAKIIGGRTSRRERKEDIEPFPIPNIDFVNRIVEIAGVLVSIPPNDNSEWRMLQMYYDNPDRKYAVEEITKKIGRRDAQSVYVSMRSLNLRLGHAYIRNTGRGTPYSFNSPINSIDLSDKKPKPVEKKPKKPEDHSLEDEYYPPGAQDKQEHKTGLILRDGKREGIYTVHYRRKNGTIKDPKQPVQIDGTDWILLNLFKTQSSFLPGEFDKTQKDKIRRLGEKLKLLGYEIAITEGVGEDIFKLRPIPINKVNGASSNEKTETKQQTPNSS